MSNTYCNTEKLEKYKKLFGKSSKGNFFVIDTIPTTHPFVVGVKHVVHASNNYGGMLGEETMKAIPCDHCHQDYSEHETALLIGCKIPIKDKNDKAVPELHKYLLKNKKNAEKENLAGFAFKDLTND